MLSVRTTGLPRLRLRLLALRGEKGQGGCQARGYEKNTFVEDEPSVLQLYQEELSEEGYEVILAKDGQRALIKFEEECPDLVIMDIRMQGIDGIHVMTALLGKNRGTQIILNSAYPIYR